MTIRSLSILLTAFAFTTILATTTASAQPIGTFTWQLRPYCNIITANVVQTGTVYTLDGWDNQCGPITGAQRAPVVGTAVLNPNGTIGLGLNIVTTPGGAPVHVDATVTLPSASGTWRDSSGNDGEFILNGNDPNLLTPRPAGGLVTAVTVGAGLSGGVSGGEVTIAVNFSGSGSSPTVARGDHDHDIGNSNTVIGDLALPATVTGSSNTAAGWSALAATTTGYQNTAVGSGALSANTSGHSNTAVGAQALMLNAVGGDRSTAIGSYALRNNTTGYSNTAVGDGAMQYNIDGINNVAIGASALALKTAGDANTALGDNALPDLTSGANNVSIGARSGESLTTGSGNIYIQADAAAAAESNTFRVGQSLARAFVSGIRGVTTGAADAIPVVIDSNGQLGTISSSRRTKDNIANLGAASHRIFDLRPVQFTYKQAFEGGATPVQYGLIAEEVAEVLPELVARGKDGEIETVKYHVLPTLLLAEVQRLERERAAQDAKLEQQAGELAALRALVLSLQRQMAEREK